jgi:hypothetical protein
LSFPLFPSISPLTWNEFSLPRKSKNKYRPISRGSDITRSPKRSQ